MRRMADVWRILGLGAVLWPSRGAGPDRHACDARNAQHGDRATGGGGGGDLALPSGGEDRDKIPAMVQTVPAEDFARTNSHSITDTLQQQIPGAVSIDVNGNFLTGFALSWLRGLADPRNATRPRRI